MAYDNDEISKAVEAHMSQSGDLRHEIDASLSGKNVDETASFSHYNHIAPSKERILKRSSFEMPLLKHPDPSLGHYDFRDKHLPRSFESHDRLLKFDEHHAYRNPHDLTYGNNLSYQRRFEKHDMHRARLEQSLLHRVGYPFSEQILSSEPHDQFYCNRKNFSENLSSFSFRRGAEVNHSTLSRSHDCRIYPEIRQISHISRNIPVAHMSPPSHFSSSIRRKSPSEYSNRLKALEKKPCRSSKRIRSRVYSDHEENEEMSFDAIMDEHRRSQLNLQCESASYAHNNEYSAPPADDDLLLSSKSGQVMPSRNDEFFARYRDHHEKSSEPSFSVLRFNEDPPVLAPPLLPYAIQDQMPIPQSHSSVFVPVESPYRVSEQPVSESTDYAQETRKHKNPTEENRSVRERPILSDKEKEDDEDDEELLQLRHEALSSAIIKNSIPRADEQSFDKKSDENDEDFKPKKRKSKHLKEKKKPSRKDAKTPPTSDNVYTGGEERDCRSSPDSNDLVQTLSSRMRSFNSPEKDFTDPKILTLGNEVMKTKTEQEQFLLREIRGLSDQEEGYKKFMDIVESKNIREERKLKTGDEVASNPERIDNYDEIEMDMDDTVQSSNIVTDANQAGATPLSDCKVEDLKFSPVPPPPGVAVEEIDVPLPPTQEKIWELLDQPLPLKAPPVKQPTPNETTTPADMLIASIRANLGRNLPGEDPTPAETGSSATSDLHSDVKSVDFPFTHESKRIPSETLPDIATDQPWKLGDLSNAPIDRDMIDVEASVPAAAVKSESDSAFEEREKRHSIEDEEELRARLLRDMALRKAKETNEYKQKSESISSNTESIVNSARNAKKIKKKRNEKAKRRLAIKQKFAKLAESRRAAVSDRKILNEADAVQNQAEVHSEELEASQIDAAGPIATDVTSSVTSSLPIASAATASVLDEPSSAFLSSRQTSPPPPTEPEQVSTKSRFQRSTVATNDNRLSEVQIPITTDQVRTTKQSSQSQSYLHHDMPGKEAARRNQASSKIGTSGVQRPLHPPVVIDLAHTSDEEEDDHVPASQPIKANFAANLSKKLPEPGGILKSASSPALLQLVNRRKRKSPNGGGGRAKRVNVPQDLLTKKVSIASQSEKCESKLSELETKLGKVIQLLALDELQLARLDQKKSAKQNEIDMLTAKLNLLKKEIEKTESGVQSTTSMLKKTTEDAKKVASTMEKRSRLKSVYLRQIAELRQQINVKSTASSKPPTERNFDSISITSDESQAYSVIEIQPVHTSAATTSSSQSSTNLDSGIAKQTVLQSSPCKSTGDIDKLHKKKALLLEKERKLKLEKEKFLLKQTEQKLNLIKQKYRQALKAKKSGKPLDHSFYQKQLKKRRSSLNQSLNKSSTATRKGRLSSGGSNSADARKKARRRSSTGLPSKSNSRKIDLIGLPTANQVVSANDKDEADEANSNPPVTPTLKRTNSHRTSSSSSISTPPVCNPQRRTPDEVLNTYPALVSLLSSDVMPKLRRRLNDVIAPPALDQCRSRSSEFLFLTDMYPVPDGFSSWSIDAFELNRSTVGSSSTSSSSSLSSSFDTSHGDLGYVSPLRKFRSYRLCSHFKADSKALKISTDTFSHKLDCNKILCRYDLTGKCLDEKCKGQHVKDISQSPSSLYLDLLWYCPQLLRTNEGEQISINDPLDLQLKAAEDTADRLLKQDHGRSVETTCSLLVAKINRALSSKCPMSSVLGKKRLQMSTNPATVGYLEEDDAEGVPTLWPRTQSLADENLSVDVESRYFDDKNHSEIKRLTAIVDQQPMNERARIALARAYLVQSKAEDLEKKIESIETALHILCIGIESNDQSEACWSAYISTLRQHNDVKPSTVEEVDVLDEALLRLPLCRDAWIEVFKWRWSFVRLNAYLMQLIKNLMNRHKILPEMNLSPDHEHAYYSSWLLFTIVERSHLMLHGSTSEEAESVISTTLRYLEQSMKGKAPDEQPFWALSQSDLVKLWLISIHLQHYMKLPSSLYDQDTSKHMFGMNIGFDDVILSFSSPGKLPTKKLRKILKRALASCTNPNESNATNAKLLLPIHQSMVNFEASLNNWWSVSTVCRDVVQLFSRDTSSDADLSFVVDVWVMWTKAIMRSNDVVVITQTFDEAVTSCPQSSCLAYMAAIYQLNSESCDEEAALEYLERYIGSVVDLEGAENLSIDRLHQLYRRLLRHDVSIASPSKLVLKKEANLSLMEKEKPYMWLTYCILTELKQGQEEADHDRIEISDLYEAALHILPSHEERRIVWIQYLLHLRSDALQPSFFDPPTSKKEKLLQRRQQFVWFSRFTSVVRRCLATTPCKFDAKLKRESDPPGSEEKVTDYSFHNEVSSIYLDCFPPSQSAVAFTVLTDAMPTNIPLLKKAAAFLLGKQDHVSVVSLLWRITSVHARNPVKSCKDEELWKMAVAGLLADNKHRKAIRFCHAAISLLPRSKLLWHDIISLTLAYGGKDDLSSLVQQFKGMLSTDINFLAEEIFLQIKET